MLVKHSTIELCLPGLTSVSRAPSQENAVILTSPSIPDPLSLTCSRPEALQQNPPESPLSWSLSNPGQELLSVTWALG